VAADDDELGPNLRALRRDRFVGVTKVARDLGLGEKTVRAAIAAGELPVYVLAS